LKGRHAGTNDARRRTKRKCAKTECGNTEDTSSGTRRNEMRDTGCRDSTHEEGATGRKHGSRVEDGEDYADGLGTSDEIVKNLGERFNDNINSNS
jgi:hypothetical protein